MGASSYTPYLELPIFADGDKPTWRGDMNRAFADIDRGAKSTNDALGVTNGNVSALGIRATNLEGRATSLEGRATGLENGKVDKGSLYVNVKDYGAKGDGVTDDTAAIQAAINASAGRTILLNGVHACSGLTLTRDVKFYGGQIPGTDPQKNPTGNRGFLRNGNNSLFTIVGTNRSSDRRGRVSFDGVVFQSGNNLSGLPVINAKYADSLVFRDCIFWQGDGQTLAGHYIYAEECWDWRFENTYFKQYGDTTKTKHAIYIFNGATDSSNDWQFVGCRWQEGLGSAVVFDSTGAGNNNAFFWFVQCKFEDTRKAASTHVTGSANRLYFIQCQFAGCGGSQVVQPSTSVGWRITQSLFALNGAGTTEFVSLSGSESSVKDSHFQSAVAGTLQCVKVVGNENEVAGCTRESTSIPIVGSGLPATTKIHHNPDFLTEYSSTAQITTGNTSVVVTHGLAYTPVNHHVSVTPHSSLAAASKFWVSNVNATDFTINVDVNPGATVTFAWQVQRVRG